MYSILFGMNKVAAECCILVDLNVHEIPRFRDAIVYEKDKKHFVEVLTRTGGVFIAKYDNKILRKNKNFITEYEDEYDPTYLHSIFRVPRYREIWVKWNDLLRDQTRTNLDLRKMFEKEFGDMNIEGTPANDRANNIAKGIELLSTPENEPKFTIITIEDLIRLGGKDGRKE